MSGVVDYHKLTVAQLKAELASRALDGTGKKAELVDRLLQHDAENAADEEPVDGDAVEVEADEEAAANGIDESQEDVNGDEETEEQEEVLDYIEMDEEPSELVDEEEQVEEIEVSKEEEEMQTEEVTQEEEATEETTEDAKKEEGEGEAADKQEGATEGEAKEGEEKEEKMETEGEKKDEVEILPLGEEDFKRLEEEAAAANEERQRDFKKRLIYRVGKNAVARFLDDSSFRKCVLITPFEFVHMENEVVSECMKKAQGINMQTSECKGEFGWLELQFGTNTDAKDAKEKLSAAFKGLDVKTVDKDHISSVTTYWEQRSVQRRGGEFNEKFRACMLLCVLDLSEEDAKTVSNDQVEDAVRPSFPGALNVAIPAQTESTETRFILVEYGTADQASAALEAAKGKDITFGEHKLSFDIYQKSWTEEKAAHKAEIEKRQKENPVPPNKKGNRFGPKQNMEVPSGPVFEPEERKALGIRIFSLYKSLEQLKESEMENKESRQKLLNNELDKLRTKMRGDDLKRKSQKLPHLPWNPNAKPGDKRPKKKAPKKTPQTPNASKPGQTPQSQKKAGQKRPRTNSASRDQPPQKQFRQGGFQQKSPGFQKQRQGGFQRPGGVRDLRTQISQPNQGRMQMQQQRPPNQQRFNKKDGRNVQVKSPSNIRVNIQGSGRPAAAAAGSFNTQRNRPGGNRPMGSGGSYNRNMGGGGGGYQSMPTRTIMGSGGGSMGGQGGGMRGQRGGNQGMGMGGGGYGSGGSRGNMGSGGGSMAGGDVGSGLDTSNPVQLLLGLSKVLSSQISKMNPGDSGSRGSSGNQSNQYQGGQQNYGGGYGSGSGRQSNYDSSYSSNTDNYGGGYGGGSSGGYGNSGSGGNYGGSGYY